MAFKIKDLGGNIFGRLKVVSLVGKIRNRYHWNCQCECGNYVNVASDLLTSGKTKSCGCLRKESPNNKLDNREDALWNLLYSSIKKKNKKYNVDLPLSLYDFRRISLEACWYCGKSEDKEIFDIRANRKISNTSILCNGIDRIDSKTGYTKDNCVSCCRLCNTAKMDMSQSDFLEHISKIYNHIIR